MTVSPVSSPKYLLYIDELKIEEVANFGRPSRPTSVPTPNSLSVSLHPVPSSSSFSSSLSLSPSASASAPLSSSASYSSPYLNKSLSFSNTISSTSKIKEVHPNLHQHQLNSPSSFASSLSYSPTKNPVGTSHGNSLLPPSLPLSPSFKPSQAQLAQLAQQQNIHSLFGQEDEQDQINEEKQKEKETEKQKESEKEKEKQKEVEKEKEKQKEKENEQETERSNYTIGYSEEVLRSFSPPSRNNPLGVGNNPDGKFLLSVTQDQLNKVS